jgi:hypothetical protein
MKFRRKPKLRFFPLGDGTQAAPLYAFEGNAAPEAMWTQGGPGKMLPGMWTVYVDQNDLDSPGLLHFFGDQRERFVKMPGEDITSFERLEGADEYPNDVFVEIRLSHGGFVVMSGPDEDVTEAIEILEAMGVPPSGP